MQAGAQHLPPLDSNADAATTAAAAPPLPPGLQLPLAAQLHVPWSLDQFVWDPSALTAAPGGPAPPAPGGGEEHSGRTGASASGPGSAAAALAAAEGAAPAPSPALAHADQAGSALAAALAAGQPLPEWPAAPPRPPSPPPGGKPAFCQVCHEGVAGLKDYYARYKICPAHCVMPGIVKDGCVLRFCQQCGRFQPIEDFDESKRTCRRKLERHNSRRRNLTKARAAGGGSAATSARSSAPATTRTPKPKRARAATPGAASDAPPGQQLKQEQQQQQAAAAGQPLPPEVARALDLPPAAVRAEAAAAAAAAGAAEAQQQQVPMELDELLSALAVQPQAQQDSPPVAAQLQPAEPLVLPSPQAGGTGGLLGLDASPMLDSPVLPGLYSSPRSAGRGRQLQPPPAVPADVAAQLQQQRQPAAAGAAPGRAVGAEFDSLIADLLGSGLPNTSNAWLADILLAPTDTAPPAGPPAALQLPAPLPPGQPQQGVPLPPVLHGFPVRSLLPADDSLVTTAASGGVPPPDAAVRADQACEAPRPSVALPALPPFPNQGLGISGLQAAPPQMQLPPLAPAAPGQLGLPQFGATVPQVPLLQQFGALAPFATAAPQVPLPPPPASLEQALAIMSQQPGGMLPLFQPQQVQPPHVQLSLKLFGVTPEALPPELRQELQSLLGSPMLEGYLRPGCTHLTLEALLQDEQQLAALRSMGVAGAVTHLLQTTSGLGRLLRAAPVLVQLGDELAIVAEGKVQRVLKLSACEGVLPRISSIRPLVLHAGNPTTSSGTVTTADPAAAGGPGTDAAGSDSACQQRLSGERILVRGSALLGEQCRLLVRSGGTYPLVEILATSGPLGAPRRAAVTAGTAGTAGVSSVFAQEDEWLEIRLPEVREGLYTVEAQRGGLLGCSRTLLALRDERAVAELRALEANPAGFTDVDAFLRSIALVLRHQQLQADGSSSGHTNGTALSSDSAADEAADGVTNSDGNTSAAAAPLAQLAARAARAGVAAAASRGWPGVAALLLPSITADGSSPAEAVRAIDALCPPGSPLLHLATASRSAPVLQVLGAWGRQQGYTWSVAAPAGPSALTPLHLVAAARDGPLFKALVDLDPAGARSGWHTAKTRDGLTPAAFAALAKQRQAAAAGTTTAAAEAASQEAAAASAAGAAAGSTTASSSPRAGRQRLLRNAAPLGAATSPLPIKPTEPPSPHSPHSPNGVAVSELELSTISSSSLSSGGSYPQLAALATGLSGCLGSGPIVLCPTAAMAPAPFLPNAFADASGEVLSSEGGIISPPTPEAKPVRLSGGAAAEAEPADNGGCKVLAVAPPISAAVLAGRAGPAAVGDGAGNGAEDGALVSASASDGTGAAVGTAVDGGSCADETDSPAHLRGSPLRCSESPALLKPGSVEAAVAAAESDADSPSAEAALERVSSGSAKSRLSARWEDAAAVGAAADIDCNGCCGAWESPAKGFGASRATIPSWADRGAVLVEHDSGCAEVLDSVRSGLGANGHAEIDALLEDLSRDDAACAAAAAAQAAALTLPATPVAKKVVEAEEEAEAAGNSMAGGCSLGTAAGRARAPWLFSLGAFAAHRLSHIFSSSLRRR